MSVSNVSPIKHLSWSLIGHVGLRPSMSVSDGSPMKNVEVYDGSPIRHVGLRWVCNQAIIDLRCDSNRSPIIFFFFNSLKRTLKLD